MTCRAVRETNTQPPVAGSAAPLCRTDQPGTPDPARGALRQACAWCEARKPAAERVAGPDVTHGICDVCRVAVDRGLWTEKLQSVLAALREPGWLSTERRAEQAARVEEVLAGLERWVGARA